MKTLLLALLTTGFALGQTALPQPYSISSVNYRCDVEVVDTAGTLAISCFQGTAIAGRAILTLGAGGKGSVFVVEEIAVLIKKSGTSTAIQVSKADSANPSGVLVFDGILPATTSRLRQWFLWFF